MKKICTVAFAILLIFCTILANSILISVTQAAESTQDETTFSVDKSQAVQTVDTTQYQGMTDSEKALSATNSLLAYYLQYGKGKGPEWLKTTDISFSFTEDHKPGYTFETIQPFAGLANKGRVWFWQGRYSHTADNASTANFGLGWRLLSPSKTSMVGLNMFYDYGFQYNLSRLGFGAEYFNKVNEYRFNLYRAKSGERLLDASSALYIRAVDGFDYELGTALKGAPWLKLYLGGFYWDNMYSADEQGFKARASMQFTPRIKLELGYYNSNYTHEPYAYLTYNLADAAGPAAWGCKKTAAEKYDISYKLLQKVQRQNDIKTETYNKGAATIIAQNTAGTRLPSVALTLTSTSAPTGTYTATTSTSGLASFSKIPTGTYTVVLMDSIGTSIDGGTITITENNDLITVNFTAYTLKVTQITNYQSYDVTINMNFYSTTGINFATCRAAIPSLATVNTDTPVGVLHVGSMYYMDGRILAPNPSLVHYRSGEYSALTATTFNVTWSGNFQYCLELK